MSRIPESLRYTLEHEWVQASTDGRVRIGITDHAQDALGDVVFVQLPEPGTIVEAGSAVGEVESTKSVSDIFAPVSGTVAARNEQLDGKPELLNSDPYGEGWLMEIIGDGLVEAGTGLLDAQAYAAHLGTD